MRPAVKDLPQSDDATEETTKEKTKGSELFFSVLSINSSDPFSALSIKQGML